MDYNRRVVLLVLLYVFACHSFGLLLLLARARRLVLGRKRLRRNTQGRNWSVISKMPDQYKYIRRLTHVSDKDCIDNLRMDRRAFVNLCYLLENIGGLKRERFVGVEEKVAIFLSILAHHKKVCVVRTDFQRSGHTISKYFKQALKATVKISNLLLVEPKPVAPDSTHPTWRHFKGCLGVLDGSYVEVFVPLVDQKRYINRKGDVSVNMLGVCDVDMNFVYVLAGWEGSAADSRVLRSALNRPHGLRVPSGHYYLVDCGYMNADGFLAPYRGCRYHLKEWGPTKQRPQNAKDYFNMKHASARNVVERAFALLKQRWSVLRSKTFYSLEVQNWIILTCAVMHNYIRRHMAEDPEERNLQVESDSDDDEESAHIGGITSTPSWNNWRDGLANTMYQEWRRG